MPSFSALDHEYMARALKLAGKGRYTAHPNPRVGCVLVLDGRIVGEGWHRTTGEAHAEINALRDAGGDASGSTAYVTLEPCSHRGKTPPCTAALIDAGVARVIYSMPDPNPEVSGRDVLVRAGIPALGGLMESRASELNRGFVSRITRGRPFVTLKIAASLDGRTAMASGESRWITGPEARADVQRLRAGSGAIPDGCRYRRGRRSVPDRSQRCDRYRWQSATSSYRRFNVENARRRRAAWTRRQHGRLLRG